MRARNVPRQRIASALERALIAIGSVASVFAVVGAARAEGVIVRGESITLGAVARTLSLPDGRILDLSRLVEPAAQRPVHGDGDYLVHDLTTGSTTLGDASTASRSLVSPEGAGNTFIGALLNEPGAIVYYATPTAAPDDLAHAEQFVADDSLGTQRLFLSDPAILLPEPGGVAMLFAGVGWLVFCRRCGDRAKAPR